MIWNFSFLQLHGEQVATPWGMEYSGDRLGEVGRYLCFTDRLSTLLGGVTPDNLIARSRKELAT